MSAVAIATVVAAWGAVALALPPWMGRRGNSRLAWQVLALLMGPLVLPFALAAALTTFPRPPVLVAEGRRRPGVDVLIALDGSRGGLATVDGALAHLGPHLGRLTLARVLPDDGPRLDEALAAEVLKAEARRLGTPDAELVLLFGRSDEALTRQAVEGGYQVVVAGYRVPGLSTRLRGSGVVVVSGPGRPAGQAHRRGIGTAVAADVVAARRLGPARLRRCSPAPVGAGGPGDSELRWPGTSDDRGSPRADLAAGGLGPCLEPDPARRREVHE
jgi:hypothetical protein